MLFIFLFFNLTYHTINIDGDLSDFLDYEKVYSDNFGDSYWGLQNEVKDLYITWDKSNLYLGIEYIVKNNALLIIFNVGEEGLQDLDNLNFYPRNIKLVGFSANFMIALWDGDLLKGGFRKISINGSTSDLTSNIEIFNKGKSGENSILEAKIPFNIFFGENFKQNASIVIISFIAGGDHSGAGDILPDNEDVDGIPPEHVRRILKIHIDKNFDSKPDSGIKPFEQTEIEEKWFERINLKEFILDREIIFEGNSVKAQIKLSQTSYIDLVLIREDGKVYKKIYNGFIVADELKEFIFKIEKQGLYILLLDIKGKLKEKKVIKVLK
ncbi:MAG: hypothetical protein ABDH37_00895 [Candidatus Hydrothermales bacterium]